TTAVPVTVIWPPVSVTAGPDSVTVTVVATDITVVRTSVPSATGVGVVPHPTQTRPKNPAAIAAATCCRTSASYLSSWAHREQLRPETLRRVTAPRSARPSAPQVSAQWPGSFRSGLEDRK